LPVGLFNAPPGRHAGGYVNRIVKERCSLEAEETVLNRRIRRAISR